MSFGSKPRKSVRCMASAVASDGVAERLPLGRRSPAEPKERGRKRQSQPDLRSLPERVELEASAPVRRRQAALAIGFEAVDRPENSPSLNDHRGSHRHCRRWRDKHDLEIEPRNADHQRYRRRDDGNGPHCNLIHVQAPRWTVSFRFRATSRCVLQVVCARCDQTRLMPWNCRRAQRQQKGRTCARPFLPVSPG